MNEIRVASMALAAYLVTSAEAMSMKRIRLPPWRVNGAYSSPITALRLVVVHADDDAVGLHEVLDRRAFLEELRDWSRPRTACVVSAATAARTFSAVPTGTVDLVTTTLGSFMLRPISRATASTCCRSAEPSSPGGVPTAMKMTRALAHRRAEVGGEGEPALRPGSAAPSARARARRSGSRSAAAGRSSPRPRRRRRRRCRSPPGRRRPPARRSRFRSPPRACQSSFGIALRVSTTSFALRLIMR